MEEGSKQSSNEFTRFIVRVLTESSGKQGSKLDVGKELLDSQSHFNRLHHRRRIKTRVRTTMQK